MDTYLSQWPNKLGYDVLDRQGNELGEVWQTRLDGQWGVRSFKQNGECERHLLIDPSAHLFMTPEHAVMLCKEQGEVIE